MNEIVEMIYQWHQGSGFKMIRRSLGFDRKTIRKYVHFAQMTGVTRDSPFPEESALITRLKEVTSLGLLRETPARDLLAPHRDWMAEMIKQVRPMLLQKLLRRGNPS